MGNKEYYTPNEEELYIGYELEYRKKFYSSISKTEWHPWREIIVDKDFFAKGYSESYYEGDIEIRTLYLFKQDIIDLVWDYTGRSIDSWFKKEGTFDMGTFKVYKIIMHYGLENHKMFIYAEDQVTE